MAGGLKAQLTWRLPDLFKLKDAIASGEKSRAWLWSHGFHSHERGYKMFVRLYPNGRQTLLSDGSGSYVSIFLRLVEGANDAHLEWPFSREYTISLMESGGKVIRSLTLDPKKCPGNPAWRQPLKSFSQSGYGRVKFISHGILAKHKGRQPFILTVTIMHPPEKSRFEELVLKVMTDERRKWILVILAILVVFTLIGIFIYPLKVLLG